MRRFSLMVVTAILFGTVGVLMWAKVTDRVFYVITNGVSMEPLYHAGDLIIVTKQDSYRKGDIVAYHVKDVTVLHRIIGGDAAGGFDIKGDNNQSVDLSRPTSSEILGSAAVHIPQGGVWLRRAFSMPVLAAVSFSLLFATGKTVHRRRRKRRPTVQKAASLVDFTGLVAAVSTPRLRVAAALIAVLALLALALGAVAWTRPTTTALAVPSSTARSMTFSYRTTVPVSAAYDGTVVTAPAPVFRTVADTVDVTFAYTGPPGEVVVNAELSIPNGWQSTVNLAAARPITSGDDPIVVRLDLDALAARATAGAKATGSAVDNVSIAIIPLVTSGGAPFAPALNLRLTPLALNLRAAGSSLTVRDAVPAPGPTKLSVPRKFHLAGRDLVSVSTSRVIAAGMLLGAILAAAAFFLVIRRSPPPSEDERIRRRHAQLLVEAKPMRAPTARPMIEVTAFETLARIAQRYGLLVLHWPDGDGTTYTVHDDAAAYRYSTATEPTEPVETIDPVEITDSAKTGDHPAESASLRSRLPRLPFRRLRTGRWSRR